MKLFLFFLLFFHLSETSAIDTSSTQSITYDIPVTTLFTTSGGPSLKMTELKNGEFSTTTSTSTYFLSCNQINYILQAKLNYILPNLDLTIQITPPPSAISTGKIILTNTNQVLITGITKTKIQNGLITYTLSQSNKHKFPKKTTGTILVLFTLSP